MNAILILTRSLLCFILLLCVAFGIFVLRSVLTEHINGPTSPSGIRIEVLVEDSAKWNPGSDFYSNVALESDNPQWSRFYWSDQMGQQSDGGVKALIKSMRWLDKDTLEFLTHNGKIVRISLNNGLWKLEEFYERIEKRVRVNA